MHKHAFVIVLAVFLLSACAKVVVKPAGVGAPPGQVQKATGYNPASGKVKAK